MCLDYAHEKRGSIPYFSASKKGTLCMQTIMNCPKNSAAMRKEKLHLENELLKLKMQAELGAHFGSMSGSALPPDIEKQFLEQVMAFHKHREEHPPVALREYLGNPGFRPSAALSPDELETEWERLLALYESKQLRVDFLAEYPLALRYDFMADELMTEEIDPPSMEGQFLCFIYEELHPNHDYDQRRRTEDFMEGFFGGTFNDSFLSPELFEEGGQTFSLAEAQALLDRFHGMFDSIREWDYQVKNTSAQTDDEISGRAPRLGFTEGLIRYVARSHDGAEQEIVGPFKLYMECVHGWWTVMSFYMHGFTWRSAGQIPDGSFTAGK